MPNLGNHKISQIIGHMNVDILRSSMTNCRFLNDRFQG